ncbi:MAG: hypothetical protein IPN85_12595 [Flavobacteriales bacterium]|nr:hypothetical protein [Flavobacteriales bacterium]MBK9289369.1 hypothetical protein [Flavobacteriales bacterium]MBL0035953.1 hypothetical protein [Flavobacteriales bacterium]
MNPWKRPYLFPLFFIVAALALGALVMLLWNAIIPGLTGWAQLNFPQALGLLVLCRILFGGFRGSGGHGGAPWKRHAEWREKWKGLSDEERSEMRKRWQERCGPPRAD